MTYSLPQYTNWFTVFRQPTSLAIVASVGIHGLVGVGLEQVPILSKQSDIAPVQLVELTPEQLGFLPEFSQSELAAIKFDTLVPPSPGDVGSGLPPASPSTEPVNPSSTDPLEPLTLPEGSSLYNSDIQASIPSFPNWLPEPPPINSTPLNQNSSPTQTPTTQIFTNSQGLSNPSPFPSVPPSNDRNNQVNQPPSPQVETVLTVPESLPDNPLPTQVETFNPSFPPTAYLPPTTPETNPPQSEFQPSPGDPNNWTVNSPLPSGVTPGQPVPTSPESIDIQARVNPNLVTPPTPGTTPTQQPDPVQPEQTSSDNSENSGLVSGLDPDAWAYQQKLRQEGAEHNQSAYNSQPQNPTSPPQQQAPILPNPGQQNPQSPNNAPSNSNPNPGPSTPQLPNNTPSNTDSEPELVAGLKPEVWAYQQALRQEFLARQAAANQAESQPQGEAIAQQPAGTTSQDNNTESASQSVSEVTEPESEQTVQRSALGEDKAQSEGGGSLSEEEKAMVEGGEEFYTWFMQLRQELPNITPKTPSSIADRYPLAACPDKLEGRAVIGTVVNPNGEIIESPKVLRGTGSEILDRDALDYVRSVGFATNDKPTAYQHSFEFNYNGETCAIAAPEQSDQNQVDNSQGESTFSDLEALGDSGSPESTSTSQQNDGLEPTLPSFETGDEQSQTSDPLTLEPEPENSNDYNIIAPVPIPTDRQ